MSLVVNLPHLDRPGTRGSIVRSDNDRRITRPKSTEDHGTRSHKPARQWLLGGYRRDAEQFNFNVLASTAGPRDTRIAASDASKAADETPTLILIAPCPTEARGTNPSKV